jgi:hypothetical protein
VRGELGHSFRSPEPRKKNEAMILYYDMKEYMERGMVCWLPQVSHYGRASQCRMKSFPLGAGSLFDIASALTRPR